MTWGKLDEAEKMYRLALGIEEELGGQQGMAKVRLEIIYAKRGDLSKAAQMHYGAFEIERRLSRKEA